MQLHSRDVHACVYGTKASGMNAGEEGPKAQIAPNHRVEEVIGFYAMEKKVTKGLKMYEEQRKSARQGKKGKGWAGWDLEERGRKQKRRRSKLRRRWKTGTESRN